MAQRKTSKSARTKVTEHEGPFGVGKKPTLRELAPPPETVLYAANSPKQAKRERSRRMRKRSSWMLETHLGGKLETVPDFPYARAMADGYASRLVDPHFGPGAVHGRRPAAALPNLVHDLTEERVFDAGHPWTRVAHTSRVPWRSICHLEITFTDNSRYTGTAWFASADTLFTAGHNIYDPERDVWAQHIRIVPGRDGAIAWFGETHAVAVDTLPGWQVPVAPGQEPDPRYDLGMIRTHSSDIGAKVGWFGYAVFSDADLATLPLVQSAGYPGETRPHGTQWYDAGRAKRFSEDFISYRADTERGQSGAPVFYSDNSDQRLVVATHVYGTRSANLGRRVTDEVFSVFDAWIDA